MKFLNDIDNASRLIQDASHRLVSDAMIASWNAKVDASRVLTDVPANAKFTDTVYTHPTGAGNNHIPTGGSTNQILRYSSSGTAVWSNENNTVYTHPTGDGNLHVPATSTTNNGKVLKAGSTAGSLVWGDDNDTITTINGKTGAITKADIVALGIPSADTNTTYSAGNGLTLTGTSFAVGTPSTITNSTTNSVTATSHTHALTLTKADIVALGIPAQDTVYVHPSGTNPHGTTASDVNLGNVTNESKATMFSSPTFTGTPTAPTATKGTNTTQIATTAFVQSAMADAVAGDMLQSIYDTDGDGKVNSAVSADYASGAGTADTLDGLHYNAFHRVSMGSIDGTNITFNTALTQGEYMVGGTNIDGTPYVGTVYGKCIVIVSNGETHNNASNWIWQIFYSTNTPQPIIRSKVNGGAWSSWIKLQDGGNANTLGSLSLNSTTKNNEANKVVRTDGNGYLQTGWIFTDSGTATGVPTRIYCSQDGYLRYYAPATFKSTLGLVDCATAKTIWVGALASKGSDANTIYFCY